MRSSRYFTLLVLAGCKGCVEVDAPPTDLVAVSADAVGVYVGEAVGAGAANVPVYAVNALGAAVHVGPVVAAPITSLRSASPLSH